MADPWESIDAFLRANGVALDEPSVGQRAGGVHAPGSLHLLGRARDYDLDNDCVAIAELLAPLAEGADFVIEELFFQSADDRGWFFDRGQEITPSASLLEAHRNHLHAGLRDGAVLPIGVFMALSDDEQRELLETQRELAEKVRELDERTRRWMSRPDTETSGGGGILRRIEAGVRNLLDGNGGPPT